MAYIGSLTKNLIETFSKEVKKKEQKKYEKECLIQLFGVDEKGKTYSLLVENFKPFFF